MNRSLQQRFGNVVRTYRTTLGISQEELADRAGLHRTYISLLERGRRNPSLSVIDALASALGTRMSEMLQDVERHKRSQ